MYDFNNKSFYDLATDIKFWRHLNPQLTISEGDDNGNWEPYELTSQQASNIRDSIVEEGYFQLPNVFEPRELEKMAQAVTVINREQWPSVFCFVYDEFWQFQHRFHNILSAILGANYKQMPNFWVFHIRPENESKGWAPHRDRAKIVNLKNDGTPLSMVFWTPLSDAYPLNGCMYILPAHLDPNYEYPHQQGASNLQDIRALPAPVGDVLAWNETVFHWGARASKRAGGARLAISTGYQTSEVGAFETPLITPGQLLPFETRIGLIGQQFHRFTVQNTFTPAVVALASKLAKLLPDNVRILDDGHKYWDIVTNIPDAPIEGRAQVTKTGQLPTPPRGFEKGRSFNPNLEARKAKKSEKHLAPK